ncbi:MAG: hypothetical protein DI589_27030, partial [Shinella sp.]
DMGRIFGFHDADHPGGMIHAIKFSQDWYRVNMPPLRAAFENEGMLALVKDDEHVADLRLVKIIRGIPMVPDARTGETNKKRHGDFAIGLALAHYASRHQWHEYGYQSVRDLDDEAADDDDDDSNTYGRQHW